MRPRGSLLATENKGSCRRGINAWSVWTRQVSWKVKSLLHSDTDETSMCSSISPAAELGGPSLRPLDDVCHFFSCQVPLLRLVWPSFALSALGQELGPNSQPQALRCLDVHGAQRFIRVRLGPPPNSRSVRGFGSPSPGPEKLPGSGGSPGAPSNRRGQERPGRTSRHSSSSRPAGHRCIQHSEDLGKVISDSQHGAENPPSSLKQQCR